ncbi:MAG: desulfoferrodoxin [Spirochaetaceae bacterium]|nr:desulfoferrodoxin [Spirochaetaceae bacterium]
MAERFKIYKCDLCGNIIEVLHAGGGNVLCCGKNMNLLQEQAADSSKEKHVPMIEKTASGYKVTVGSTIHPMIDTHYVEWIELIADGISYKKFFKPGDQPVAEFSVKADKVSAREYCNLHFLWKS